MNQLSFKVNSICRVLLVLFGIYLILDLYYIHLLHKLVIVLLVVGIFSYLTYSKLSYRLRESRRILRENTYCWKYKRLRLNWEALLQACLCLVFHTKLDGESQYLLLSLGIGSALTFVFDAIVSLQHQNQLISIESNTLVHIRNQVELIHLSDYEFVSRTEEFLILKKRWRTIKLVQDEFYDSEDMLDVLESKLQISLVDV